MPILCRPAREEDLERSDQLVVATLNHLTQRPGFGPMAASHPTDFQMFSLKDDAGVLWVAEEANEILGFAWSWGCPRVVVCLSAFRVARSSKPQHRQRIAETDI